MRSSVLLLICCLVIGLKRTIAQDSLNALGHVSIASPTAASLGKYGDIPVNYHTGIPQIGIPLYTVKAGNLSLPIGLNYHASGLKVMEPASWVGAGWSLDAGGVITRTVMGQPDEKGTNAGSVETNGHFSDYGFNNYLYASGVQDWLGFGARRKDGEPDLFFFNFGGYSGKFYFRDDRTPVIVPQQDLKIVPYFPADTMTSFSYVNGDGCIQGFTVTTPDGTQYFFGKTPGFSGTSPFEITNPYNAENGSGGYSISSWYLAKVQSADGQFAINLKYVTENYGYFTLSMFPIDPTIPPGFTGFPLEYNLVKNIMTGVRLSQITFPNGTVNFLAGSARTDLSDSSLSMRNDATNTHATTLGALQITDSSGFCKKFKFYYGYFSDNSTGLPGYYATAGGYTLTTDKQRLRLDSLQEISCDSFVRIPPYKFSYYSEQVPRRLSFGLDHWGFYNGITSNTTLIPTYTLNSSVHTGATRDAAWPAMRGGSLNQITYPTGGSTTFNFEPHYVVANQYSTAVVPIINVSAHLYGQDTQFTNVDSFYTDGNEITFDLNNTTAYNATFQIKTLGGTVVYTSTLPSNTHTTTQTVTLTAGSYKAYVTVDPASVVNTGLLASGTQLGTVTTAVNTLIGGLRIQSIVNNDGVGGNPITTSYSYNNPSGMSTGVLYSIPVYVQQIRNDLIANLGYYDYTTHSFNTTLGNINGCPGFGGDYVLSGGSIRPMATVQGNHIGYQTVTVSQSGNGYSTYNYYVGAFGSTGTLPDVCVRSATVNAGCNPSTPNFPAAPPPFDYTRGELYYEQHFTNAGHLLKDIFYYPSYDTSSFLSTPAFSVNSHATGSAVVLLGTKYQLPGIRKTKLMTVEDDVDMNTSTAVTTTKTVYYSSPYHNAVTRTVSNTSTGDSLAQTTKYAFDFRVTACDTISDGSSLYNGTCASCLTTFVTADTACHDPNRWSCISTAYLNYLLCQANARIRYDSIRKVNCMNPTNAFNTCHTNARNAADALLKPVLRLQDEFYNAPVEVSDWKNTNLRHADFSQYDTSSSPLGFAYPGRTQLINLQATSTTFTAATISGTTITKDSRYLDENIFKFSTGNPQQVIPHNGLSLAYIWDYKNTHPIAKTVNTTVDQIAYTSFEADGNGSWSIPSGTRDAANAITGKQSYNLTNGACTRSGLTSGNSYVVSYWSKASSYTVTGSTATNKGKTINGWTYYEHTVTGTTSVSVSGSNDIDELRLYPATAQMTTYTYSPLVGMTSQCDVDNRTSYYTYDALGRLKAIKDQDGNILKQYDYQYQNSNRCGTNCYILPGQTSAGTNLLGYPVGVFDLHGKLLGNAAGATQFVSLWNADTADSRIGTLAVSTDSLHFNLTLNTGMVLPAAVTGLRYYQVDLAWNKFDGIRNGNATYVDFGDGTGMRLPSDPTTVASPLAPNTTYSMASSAEYNAIVPYYIHTYADSTQKTVTFYHTDSIGNDHLDNYNNPAGTMIRLKNLRGNLPQNLTILGASSYQQASMNKVDSIHNWNSIRTIQYINFISGDGVNPCKNMGYTQDFMQYNPGLQKIHTTNGYYSNGYRDTTFKLSRLKSNWNTYFTGLQVLIINDDHWNREDLSALKQLNYVQVVATTQDHQDDVNSPLIPIPSATIDAIINQVAAGAGQSVSNGAIYIFAGGSARTSASDTAVTTLTAKGWTITIF